MPTIKFCSNPGCRTRIGLETPDGLCDEHAGRSLYDFISTYDMERARQLETLKRQEAENANSRISYRCEHCSVCMPEHRKVPGERFCSDLCKSLHAHRGGPASCAKSKPVTAR